MVMHPVRIKIISYINQKGAATTQEIAKLNSDIPPATLYRHINKLCNDGIIEVAKENKINGILEKVYQMKENPLAEFTEILETNNAEQLMNLFYSFTLMLLSDFQKYTARQNVNITEDGVGFNSAHLYLSDEELAEMMEELRSNIVKRAVNEPSKIRKLRKVSLVLVPVDVNDEAE
jgi:DNA-binding PadR family transcriptional regulator